MTVSSESYPHDANLIKENQNGDHAIFASGSQGRVEQMARSLKECSKITFGRRYDEDVA